MNAALAAADPTRIIRKNLKLTGSILYVGKLHYPLEDYPRAGDNSRLSASDASNSSNKVSSSDSSDTDPQGRGGCSSYATLGR